MAVLPVAELDVVAWLFGLGLLVAIAATAAVRHFAVRHGLLDAATSSRKIHSVPIPRLGGVGNAAGLTAVLLGALAVRPPLEVLNLGSMLRGGSFVLAAGLIVGIGLVDDLKGVRAVTKLGVQVLAALVLVGSGVQMEAIELTPSLHLGLGVLGPVITVVWIVGVINAINLIDGMDGLAGGISFLASLAFLFLALRAGDGFAAFVAAGIAAGSLGFLVFNSHPASIFMGDAGSMLLGLSLAFLGVEVAGKADGAVALPSSALIIGLPILDTLVAFVRRALIGRSPFSADREHLHHRIMARLGAGHGLTVLLMWGISCAFVGLGLAVTFAEGVMAALLWLFAAALVSALLVGLQYVGAGKESRRTQVRRRNAELRSRLRDVYVALSDAATMDAVWSAVEPVTDLLGLSKFELQLREGDGFSALFQETRAGDGPTVLVQFPVRFNGRAVGRLVAVWRDGRSEIDRDHELAIEAIGDRLERCLARMARSSGDVLLLPVPGGVERGGTRSAGTSDPAIRSASNLRASHN